VLASTGLGAFAEQVSVAAAATTRLPDNLDAARAATFTQSYATALFSLRDRAGLQPGESVLVLGAGGGIGLATVDVARAMGAHVIAAASSPEKRAAAEAIGAEAAIDTLAEPLKDRARELAAALGAEHGRALPVTGVDLVADPIGGELADPALRALGNGGRYVVIGFASGTIPSLPLNQVLLRNRTVVGVDWGAWAMQQPDQQQALVEELLGWVGEGRLHPTAPTTYPLDEVGRALDDLLERKVVGKLALVP